MPRGIFADKSESLVMEEFDTTLQDNQVRILSEFSAIKHGTDLHILSGKSPFQNMTFDLQLRLFVEQPEETQLGKRPFGNTTVGTVIEIGSKVTNFKMGDKVYTYGQIADTIVANEKDTEALLPSMTAADAVCMDPAFFALSAVRDAGVKPGDNVVVFGLGAIGMFIIQFLKLNGCLEIIAVDPMKKRRDLAKRYGATVVLDPTECDVSLEIRRLIGKGTDVAMEASGHYSALRESLRAVNQCGKIVTLGYYKGKALDLALGQEWHHNRLSIISSMPVWGNPMRDYPLWDEDRLRETLKQMFSRKMISSEHIVDPIVEFDQAVDAIMNVYHNPSESIKLGVVYPNNALSKLGASQQDES